MKNSSQSNTLEYVNERLSLLEDQYIKSEPLRVYCGTFNVNGKLPDESLRPWLCVQAPDGKPVDIFALGFQELVDLNTISLLMQSEAAERESYWTNILNHDMLNENNFKSRTKYRLLSQVRMFGLFLIVYVKESLLEKQYVREVLTSSVATGIMDFVGNKGSVGVSVKVHETRICFVCSHLAADTDKLEKRNADYRSCQQRLKFYPDPTDYSIFYDLENSHDAVFWFGDLNYRLEQISLQDTFRLIFASDYENLLKWDQLSNERLRRRAFEHYIEGRINFPPTYKYLVKSDLYEKQSLVQQLSDSPPKQQVESKITSGSNWSIGSSNSDDYNAIVANQQTPIQGKIKLPSWCDRVLYRSSELKCELVQYSCVNTITISDHKPVYALLELQVKRVDQKKKQKLYDDLLKESDRKVNEEMPRIAIEKFEFNFDECMYYEKRKMTLVVKNEGVSRANVVLFFYDNDEISGKSSSSKSSDKNWISMMPTHREKLEPGGSFEVDLAINFRIQQLARLNKNKNLDDFLILRCLNGNDLFVTLSCVYVPSIIGISLKALSTLNQAGQTFGNCDQTNLIEQVETRIDSYEKRIDEMFKEQLRVNTVTVQKEQVDKMLNKLEIGNETPRTNEQTASSFQTSKLEIFNRTLSIMKPELIDNDDYFLNDLSTEYRFFMEHLISRCTFNLQNALSSSANLADASSPSNTNNVSSTLTIEEQKNLALHYLSSKLFFEFEEAKFDLELLAELLYDLLYALPHTLVPSRYIDYCIYADSSYEKCLTLMIYLPRPHLTLFELIIKYLQIYLKCLHTCSSAYNETLAEAIFQTNKSRQRRTATSPNATVAGLDDCQTQTACRFLKIFIDNHKQFLTI